MPVTLPMTPVTIATRSLGFIPVEGVGVGAIVGEAIVTAGGGTGVIDGDGTSGGIGDSTAGEPSGRVRSAASETVAIRTSGAKMRSVTGLFHHSL